MALDDESSGGDAAAAPRFMLASPDAQAASCHVVLNFISNVLLLRHSGNCTSSSLRQQLAGTVRCHQLLVAVAAVSRRRCASTEHQETLHVR